MHGNPFRREEDLCHFTEGLRLAGLGEIDGAAPPAATAPATVAWPIGNTFRKEGALWMVCFEHEVAHTPEVRGFQVSPVTQSVPPKIEIEGIKMYHP